MRGALCRRAISTVALVVLVSLGSSADSASASGACPNEALRIEQGSTYLPGCRAYELVGPPGIAPLVGPSEAGTGAEQLFGAQAAFDGEAFAWATYYPQDDASSAGVPYLSRRDTEGWGSESVVPAQTSGRAGLGPCLPSVYFSSDLATGILVDGDESDAATHEAQEYCEHNQTELVEDEPEGSQNLFLRDNSTATYRLLNPLPQGEAPANAWLQDATPDLSHVVFAEDAKLTAEAPAGEALYEWAESTLHLVSVLPDGTATPGALADAVPPDEGTAGTHIGAARYAHALSNDGSRVVFTAEGDLYLRLNATAGQSPIAEGSTAVNGEQCETASDACTIQLDASDAGGAGGGGQFVAANPGVTRVFFTDAPDAELTANTLAGSGENLYEYNVQTGALSDLTPYQHAEVMPNYVGFGEESANTYGLYFVASGGFPATGATTTECVSPTKGPRASGACNLYAYAASSGTVDTQLVAVLSDSTDQHDWTPGGLTARTSPSGRYLAFTSIDKPATARFPGGYENTPKNLADCEVLGKPGPCSEVYLYDAATDVLHCVSCSTSRAPTTATTINAVTQLSWGSMPGYLSRLVTDEGRVFFDTREALVEGDTNGVSDVYEYENGQLRLLSTGTGTRGAYIYDTSGRSETTGAEAEDVFFATAQRLVQRDTDNGLSVYDARVDGGFAEPNSPAAACSSGEECRGTAEMPSLFSPPISGAFAGAENITAPTQKGAKGHTGKAKGAVKRRRELRRALQRCRHIYRRNRRVRRACKRRARKQFGAKARGARQHRGRRQHRSRHQQRGAR